MKRMTDTNQNTSEAFNKIFKKTRARDDFFDYSSNKRHGALLIHFEGGKLLDVGCLNSPLCLIAQKRHPTANITVLDFAPEVIDYFKKNYIYEAVLSDCCHTPFQDNTFDYITAGEVIEHLEKPEELIKEMARILKPKGVFALSTPCEEENNECGGGYHIWSFEHQDIKKLLEPYGKVRVAFLGRDNRLGYIIGFLIK